MKYLLTCYTYRIQCKYLQNMRKLSRPAYPTALIARRAAPVRVHMTIFFSFFLSFLGIVRKIQVLIFSEKPAEVASPSTDLIGLISYLIVWLIIFKVLNLLQNSKYSSFKACIFMYHYIYSYIQNVNNPVPYHSFIHNFNKIMVKIQLFILSGCLSINHFLHDQFVSSLVSQ